VTFAPAAVTNYSGTVTVNSDKTSGTNTISASGSGIAVQALDYTYTTNSGQITITRYIGSGGAVTIPSTINGLPVTGIGNNAFQSKSSLISVIIPAGVTNIGSYAFYDCPGLTNAIIGSGVTSIGSFTFGSCYSLKNVTIGNSVTSIGDYAFYNCNSLNSVYFQGNAPGVGTGVFNGANNATVYRLSGATGWPTVPDLWAGRPTALWTLPTKIIGLSGNLSFGSVVTGQTSTASLTITNSGNTALTVTNITYPTCFSGAWSGTVAAGKATNVTVTFAPVAVTNYSGTVTVNSDKTSGTNTISASGSGIRPTFTDDFNDNTKDTAKWDDDMLFNGTNAVLQETNGRLEFSKATVDDSGVIRPWAYGVGSYTQDWEASVDTYLGDIALSLRAGANMNLVVVNLADTNLVSGALPRDNLSIALDLYRYGGTLLRGYEMISRVNGVEFFDEPNYGYASTTNLQGRLKIVFDSATKVLTASYNGNVLGWMDVDDLSSNWEMAAGDTFGIAIAGRSMSANVSGNQAYADNFEMIGMVAATPSADGDGNGLPDWWEQQHFGGTGVNPNAVCSNRVNTVIQAYVAGLNPTNSSARFGITNHSRNLIQWNAVSGRVYNVYWTTNLMNGFQTLQTNYTGGAITDSVRSAASKCFYKIDVRLAP
ncbi:MAG: leucine-rich repeat protein, partial [Kiritimatiellales bacterium]